MRIWIEARGAVSLVCITESGKKREKEGQNAVLGKTATLEMTPDDVEILGKARLSGTLSLALRSIADGKTTVVATATNSKLITVYRGSGSSDVLSCTPLCARR
jgi:pilus assembly protein CpaB